MHRLTSMAPRERLVHCVQDLERLEELKKLAADNLRDGFDRAKTEGYDTKTLKVVLRLRKMTPSQRSERRALEAIYMAALGMLEGEPLPEEARRRLDEEMRAATQPPEGGDDAAAGDSQPDLTSAAPGWQPDDSGPTPLEVAPPPAQPQLALKTPEEARLEGTEAALAGKRIYDNPYRAGDPCRAAWDEGWCAQQGSHGMETPSAYQRRGTKPAEAPSAPDQGGGGGDDEPKGGE